MVLASHIHSIAYNLAKKFCCSFQINITVGIDKKKCSHHLMYIIAIKKKIERKKERERERERERDRECVAEGIQMFRDPIIRSTRIAGKTKAST